MPSSLPEIEERENEYPDEIDEMPVEPRDLDDLVVAAAALVIAAQHLHRDDDEIDYARGHVHAVKARDHEERGAELLCAHRVAPRPNAFVDDELRPLECLHADEHGAESGRDQHQRRRAAAIAAIAV